MEKRLIKVLKAMAEYHDMSPGNLMAGVILHALDGNSPFGESSIERIQQFRQIYGMDYDSRAVHNFVEETKKS